MHKNIQVFLKFINFYYCFIKDFFKILKLLNSFLKKEKTEKFRELFILIKKIKQMFFNLYTAFIIILILMHCDFKLLI